ncbi:4-(cytidine 5'-diphospho)-2-C-methyl-D-erythritol kinase [Albibacterium bauzanense]|uniref:4-diphosphocytidyl-2-C-methyl-D-erythritol kinase n=1 Tax=Albibacterium bauzanense TaxID=653929 RepID=A0A4R1M0F1_9SPHI|nr:4-(cytidine 5'-diphospho)-2-C-methyl-D-erythritol kinase [Albibacterium bauzanense]TCK85366.1 4-diphosphocytidyl-2-C-methyl-D-erythritol kinase [Albibacterium bauzanense]
MITFPNAKINLGLQVLRKRSDGYHDIETVLYPIPIYDALEIVEASETKLFVSGIPIPDGGDNLCSRVYNLLGGIYKLSPIHIYLHKRIPIGAGLGGGSSDAAFLIKLMNDYFNLKLESEQMMNYARTMGADCSFFINNKSVFAEGIGDQFLEIEIDLSAYHLLVVNPPIHINTAEAYGGVLLKEDGRNLKEMILEPINTWKETIFNDFEATVFKKFPSIGQIKQDLYDAGAVYAAMSGSGSSLFAIFDQAVCLPDLAKSNQVIYC